MTRLGVQAGDRVGTFMWNNQTHLEAYLAIPCMGAVLHTLNIRLFPEQLAFVINHAEDKIIIVDASIAAVVGSVPGVTPPGGVYPRASLSIERGNPPCSSAIAGT